MTQICYFCCDKAEKQLILIFEQTMHTFINALFSLLS